LSHEEDLLLYAKVLDEVGDRVKVIAGTGSNSTKTSIRYTQLAENIGCHGAMIVVPYYNKPSQEGMFQHFSAIAAETSLPLMMYNIPGRTGINMLPDTVLRIAERNGNIMAIKEASGNLEQMKQIITLNKRKDFFLYSGDDNLTLDVMKLGGVGVVSVAAHLVGREMQFMIKAYLDGKVKEAEAINDRLAEFFKVIFITSNPAPIKAALTFSGLDVGGPRLPLVAVNTVESEAIYKVMKDLGLIHA
jgi:4-hydroxy-tetrahydrodipicolinate synthase